MQLLEFQPLYMERAWGGRGLETKLKRVLPEGKTIGESWEIVDRDDAQSVVANGPYAGRTLRELRAAHGPEIFGPQMDTEKPFAILVKWLDCQDRLSLQVHPPAAIAPSLGGEPKTENWYIADADPGASLIVGLKKGVTRERFEQALGDSKLEECVHRFPVGKGDSIFVESGRIHAIDAGNLILEIQQNSDTTYRVYDWGRVGLDGNPRQLHIDASMQSINFADFEPEPIRAKTGNQVLAECGAFRIRKFDLIPGERAIHLPRNQEPRLIHVVSGTVFANDDALSIGSNYLQPFGMAVSLTAREPSIVLVTDQIASASQEEQ